MIPAGWVMMIVSLTFVLGLLAFCFGRVLTAPTEEEDSGDFGGDVQQAEWDR